MCETGMTGTYDATVKCNFDHHKVWFGLIFLGSSQNRMLNHSKNNLPDQIWSPEDWSWMDLWRLQLVPHSPPGDKNTLNQLQKSVQQLFFFMFLSFSININPTQRFIVAIPEGFPLEAAGPVFCAGRPTSSSSSSSSSSSVPTSSSSSSSFDYCHDVIFM